MVSRGTFDRQRRSKLNLNNFRVAIQPLNGSRASHKSSPSSLICVHSLRVATGLSPSHTMLRANSRVAQLSEAGVAMPRITDGSSRQEKKKKRGEGTECPDGRTNLYIMIHELPFFYTYIYKFTDIFTDIHIIRPPMEAHGMPFSTRF